MISEAVCTLYHFIPFSPIVEDVVSVFHPRIKLSGLVHSWPCGWLRLWTVEDDFSLRDRQPSPSIKVLGKSTMVYVFLKTIEETFRDNWITKVASP